MSNFSAHCYSAKVIATSFSSITSTSLFLTCNIMVQRKKRISDDVLPNEPMHAPIHKAEDRRIQLHTSSFKEKLAYSSHKSTNMRKNIVFSVS
jgi:hypothetical protein